MGLSWGSIVVMDLDRFERYVLERGFSVYTPNVVTGTLSALVDSLARRFQAIIVYGLDWERGTEEAVLEVPGVEAMELRDELVRVAEEISRLGASITIVALTGYVSCTPARSRREAYTGYLRSRAWRIVRALKRRCGGVVYVDGVIVWSRVSSGAPQPQGCNRSSSLS